MKEKLSARCWLALAALVLLLAAGLHLHRIDAQSLWNDEGTSVAMAERTAAQIVSNTAARRVES